MTSLRTAKFDSWRAARCGAPANGARILRFKTAILALIRVGLVRFPVPLRGSQPVSWRATLEEPIFAVIYRKTNSSRATSFSKSSQPPKSA